MRTISHLEMPQTYNKWGLMELYKHFEQRKIGKTHGSFRSLIALRTPSGPQETESELETELVEQLAFTPVVWDLLTQPVIHYTKDGKPHTYTPDIVVQMRSINTEYPMRYLIEVKREEDLERNKEEYKIKFEVGNIAAENMGGVFRIITDKQIRTPYLRNAKLLRKHMANDLDDYEADSVTRLLENKEMPFDEAISLMGKQNIAEPSARHLLERAVANRWLKCDFSREFSDNSHIVSLNHGSKHSDRYMLDLLHNAKSS